MPTNPYDPPQEPNADGQIRSYRVRHDAKFWLWAIALATLVAPMGAALGVFALMAVVILVVLLKLPLPPAYFEAWPMVILGGILISELFVVKWVLDRSHRIRAVHHRVALKSLHKSMP